MNYGVIGNCQVAALIDEQARMVWACLPRPDGDPVFSALLQKEGGDSEKGVFAIDINLMPLQTFTRRRFRHLCCRGIVELIEFFCLGDSRMLGRSSRTRCVRFGLNPACIRRQKSATFRPSV